MTVVNGKLVTPVGTFPTNGTVTIQLVDYEDTPVIGFNTAGDTEVISTSVVTPSSSGTWTANLVGQGSIELANGDSATVYRVTESGAGVTYSYHIVVPTSDDPVWAGDCRADVGEGSITYFGTTLWAVATFTGAEASTSLIDVPVPIMFPPSDMVITAVKASRVGGTGATINVFNGDDAVLNIDLSITSEGAPISAPALQNVEIDANTPLSAQVMSSGGAPDAVCVQVELRMA